jgi:PilZ domain
MRHAATNKAALDNRRSHPRINCGETQLHAIVRFEDGETQEFRLVARNVSKGGIALWREKPMVEGAVCTLALPTHSDEMIGIAGRVAFSKRLGMTVNEIGIQFDRPLDDDEFALLEITDAAA